MHGAKSRQRTRRQKQVVGALSATGVLVSCAAAWANDAENHVTSVKAHAVSGVARGAEIDIQGTSPPVYSARVTDGGKRLLVDIAGADVQGDVQSITTSVGVLGGVLTQGFKTNAGVFTRLSVSLAETAAYELRPRGNSLAILLAPAATTQVAPSPLPFEPSVDAQPASKVTSTVTGIRFERSPQGVSSCSESATGCDRIVVDLTSVPSYTFATTPGGRRRLELKTTKLSDSAARTLDVTQYRGALRTVSAFTDASAGATIIELDEAVDAAGSVSVEAGQLVWAFAVPKVRVEPSPLGSVDSGPLRRAITVAHEELPPDLPKVETSIRGGQIQISETPEESQAGFASTGAVLGQRYTGKRIELDFKDVDIHNILRMLAEVGHVNIVAADDVSGNITIRMRNVPWDQALDVVLQAKGLGMLRTGNLIRVAPLAQLQKERELRLAQMKSEADLAPIDMRLIPINYAKAADMQARAKELLSHRGTLSVDERTNTLIVRDLPGNTSQIENLVRVLDSQTSQVLIEARIVEATSKYVRDIGIQWGGDATFSPATGNPTGIAFPASMLMSGGNYDSNTPTAGLSPFQRTVSQPNFAVNMPAAVGTGSGGAIGFSFGSIDNLFNLNLRLSAAESSGLLRVVSSPRILTLDNREARINEGTLLPFAQVSAMGVQTTFQEAKLQLLVKPHVTSDGSISMHVKITRDEPDFSQTSPRGDPTILKREAETDLLVMDGHTAVIGGIFTRNTGRNLTQVPFFGDIPIIGVLFQHRTSNDQRDELVIFLTPRIVNRADPTSR